MLQVSYEIGGVVVAVLLIGFWVLRGVIRRRRLEQTDGINPVNPDLSGQSHAIEHRALMFLMTQKTDSVLAALARTIEQERQKLGVDVRNPSIAAANDAFQTEAIDPENRSLSTYDQILPLARNGLTVPKIAGQLQLPEGEVAMVMRLSAA